MYEEQLFKRSEGSGMFDILSCRFRDACICKSFSGQFYCFQLQDSQTSWDICNQCIFFIFFQLHKWVIDPTLGSGILIKIRKYIVSRPTLRNLILNCLFLLVCADSLIRRVRECMLRRGAVRSAQLVQRHTQPTYITRGGCQTMLGWFLTI